MRVPEATYRLQIHAGFTLRDALDLVPYLRSLGISHLYLSPVFEATPGSTHGYDVTDPTRISAAVGGMDALAELAAAAQAHGMGILLDIVPNHMAASELNPWWRDVMRHGRTSRFASFFDIAWDAEPRDRLTLPILGDDLAAVISRDEITVATGDDGPGIRYFDRTFPVADDSTTPELLADAQSGDADRRRHAIADILGAQHYELVHWKTTATEIGYRRFFDVTGLAGLRVELPEVFDASHSLVKQLVATNVIDALRIDHIDGLRNPEAYLDRLRTDVTSDGPVYTVVEKILELGEQLPDWPVEGTTGYDFLSDVSGLFIDPAGLPLLLAQYARMTGSNATFEDVVREKKHLVLQRLFAGELRTLAEIVGQIMADMGVRFTGETVEHALRSITAAMPVYRTYITTSHITAVDHRHIDQALHDAHAYTHDIAAAADDTVETLRAIDAIGRVILLDVPAHLEQRAMDFVQRWQQLTGPVMAKGVEDTAFYTFTALTSANEVGGGPGQPCVSVGEFHERMRTRIATMPHTMNATATHDTKRGEDVRTRIHALTELAPEWTRLLRSWVRRSEVYKEEAQGETGLETDEDETVPDAKEEILLYQTLVGAWPPEPRASDDESDNGPSFTDRVQEYMKKAIREGKDNTSWVSPDEDYESTLDVFLERLLRAPSRPRLRAEINDFADRLAWHGMLASLSQTLIKIAAPGIPDFYQGTELWSLVLVDPDNRRPVDFTLRAELRAQLDPVLDAPSPDTVASLFDSWRDARIKMYLTSQALRFRRMRAALCRDGEYIPVHATGEHAERVVAFARHLDGEWVMLVVPRLTASLAPPETPPIGSVWGDTSLDLPDGVPLSWMNVLTNEEPMSLMLADVFRTLPYALLVPSV
jgi:(1->4)-alpha-D-glucan 1-alpha-D-glucosylmutase